MFLQTCIGMTIGSMHTDPAVFPDPLKFIPERWVGDHDPRMDQYFVPFSKGSRNCLGMKSGTLTSPLFISISLFAYR